MITSLIEWMQPQLHFVYYPSGEDWFNLFKYTTFFTLLPPTLVNVPTELSTFTTRQSYIYYVYICIYTVEEFCWETTARNLVRHCQKYRHEFCTTLQNDLWPLDACPFWIITWNEAEIVIQNVKQQTPSSVIFLHTNSLTTGLDSTHDKSTDRRDVWSWML